MYRGAKIRFISNFSETMKTRRKWSEIFKLSREEMKPKHSVKLKQYLFYIRHKGKYICQTKLYE